MKKHALRLMLLAGLMTLCLPCLAESNPVVGDSVVIGQWEQDNDLGNGSEPLEWLVLDVQDSKALLITRYAIDSRQFHDQWADTTWEACQLRAWLNRDFMTAAFTPQEQAAILVTELETPENMSYHTSGGGNTRDQLFILSIEEAKQYLPSAKARQAQGTAWAKERQLYVKKAGVNAGYCWWWLRTMGQIADAAVYVKDDGSILFKGYDVDFYSGGVRPAMWVDWTLLESAAFSSGIPSA